jgi:peptide deformylase
MILKIVDIKDPVLRKKAKRVQKIDKKIQRLIADMKETLLAQKDPEGVGLAAPQVGKPLQIFIMHYPEEGMNSKVVINPVVLKISEKKSRKRKKGEKDILEGCLSLPYYYGPVERAKTIKIKYTSENGERLTEEFGGFSAHIVQHEIDHLMGKLFIDHVLSQKSRLFYIEEGEVEEVEI